MLKTSERTPFAVDRAGGGLDVLGQLLLGNQGTASVLSQAEFRDGVIDLMNQLQLADGSWTPGNQFATMRRWSLPTANQATTMWATLALAACEVPGSERSATIEKAIAYQRQQSPNPDNREWLATRLLFERHFGSADEIAQLRQQLLAACNSDGGWGWERVLPAIRIRLDWRFTYSRRSKPAMARTFFNTLAHFCSRHSKPMVPG